MNEQMKMLTERLVRIENLLEQLLVQAKETDVGDNSNKPLSIKQAADYLHLSVSRMYSLIYQKKLNPVQRKRNSKLLFYVNELNRYLRTRSNTD